MPLRKVSNKKTVANKPTKDPVDPKDPKKKKYKPGKMGNPAVVETYEDARENAMINRNVPTMKEGGYCRGVGAAIKGTKFEGVF
jgi:hypothetical protein